MLSRGELRIKELSDISNEIGDATLRGDRKKIEHYNQLFESNFRLNDEMKAKLAKAYDDIFAAPREEHKKILGVKFRSADYIQYLALNHNIQPTADEMVKKCRVFLQQYRYDYLFLCVEDAEVRKAFQNAFEEKLLFYDAPLASYSQRGDIVAMGSVAKEQLGAYQSAESYLMEILLLSKCDSLLASGNSGVVCAIIANNNKYEHLSIVDCGKSRSTTHFSGDELRKLQEGLLR